MQTWVGGRRVGEAATWLNERHVIGLQVVLSPASDEHDEGAMVVATTTDGNEHYLGWFGSWTEAEQAVIIATGAEASRNGTPPRRPRSS